MFTKILVPLDGSMLAERALEPALTLAQQQANSELILLRVPVARQLVVTGRAGYGFLLPHQSVEFNEKESRTYLDKLVKSHTRPDLTLRPIIQRGDEAGIIVDTAEDEEVDLIIMSTHGYSGMTRWTLGSVTERVLHNAPCPVMILRNEQPITQIVLLLDGSELAEQALAPGLALADALGAKVTLLRVVDPVQVETEKMAQLVRAEGRSPDAAGLPETAGSYLTRIRRSQHTADLTINTALLDGPPAEIILDYVATKGIDLVAMATHGHTGLRRWVYGSTTDKVLRSGLCNMLIVRPAGHDLRD